VCSDDDLRAIVHKHQLRWSPQLMSTSRRRQPSSRASSLDTASHSQSAVFSSSVESLSQSPVFPTPHSSVRLKPSDNTGSDAPPQSAGSSTASTSTDTQPRRRVFSYYQVNFGLRRWWDLQLRFDCNSTIRRPTCGYVTTVRLPLCAGCCDAVVTAASGLHQCELNDL